MELKKFWTQDRIPKWNYTVKIIVSITSPRERNRLFVFLTPFTIKIVTLTPNL